MITDIKYQNNLELKLKTDRSCQTICQHQYTTYPLRLSSIFRLEGATTNRAYLYSINTSPGLLANDVVTTSLYLAENTKLYFTDRDATKVHPMPKVDNQATIDNQIVLENNASLEWFPEPIILYRDSVLEQKTQIKLYPQAKLFLTEIILPGRLARGEYYDFKHYSNRLKIVDAEDKILYIDAMHLLGQTNLFQNDRLFASLPIMGNAIAILPEVDLSLLIEAIKSTSLISDRNIETAITILPSENGIAIRALASKTREIKRCFANILSRIRHINRDNPLPYVPK